MEKKGEFCCTCQRSSFILVSGLEGKCSGPDNGTIESAKCDAMNLGMQPEVSSATC